MAKRGYKPPKMKSDQVFREAVLACGFYNNFESEPECLKTISGVCDATQWSWVPCSVFPAPNMS